MFRGKIIDLERVIEKGFNFGKTIIEGFDYYKGKTMQVNFQNENLLCKETNLETNESRFVASVPDLISLVDNERF